MIDASVPRTATAKQIEASTQRVHTTGIEIFNERMSRISLRRARD